MQQKNNNIEMELQRHGREETVPEVIELYNRVTDNRICNPWGESRIELLNTVVLVTFCCFLSSFHKKENTTFQSPLLC